MEAVEELTYLMGGQIDLGDVVTYPEAGSFLIQCARVHGARVFVPNQQQPINDRFRLETIDACLGGSGSNGPTRQGR